MGVSPTCKVEGMPIQTLPPLPSATKTGTLASTSIPECKVAPPELESLDTAIQKAGDDLELIMYEFERNAEKFAKYKEIPPVGPHIKAAAAQRKLQPAIESSDLTAKKSYVDTATNLSKRLFASLESYNKVISDQLSAERREREQINSKRAALLDNVASAIQTLTAGLKVPKGTNPYEAQLMGFVLEIRIERWNALGIRARNEFGLVGMNYYVKKAEHLANVDGVIINYFQKQSTEMAAKNPDLMQEFALILLEAEWRLKRAYIKDLEAELEFFTKNGFKLITQAYAKEIDQLKPSSEKLDVRDLAALEKIAKLWGSHSDRFAPIHLYFKQLIKVETNLIELLTKLPPEKQALLLKDALLPTPKDQIQTQQQIQTYIQAINAFLVKFRANV